MMTQFVTVEIDLHQSPVVMHHAIEAALQQWGDPLRWAVTAVKVKEQKAVIEAIVTRKGKG